MNIKKLLTMTVALALSGALMTGCASDGGSTPNSADNKNGVSASVVNIAIQPSAAFVPLYIARENGWIEEALQDMNVTVNWNDFESGPPMNESLASGNSDFGVMGDVPTVSSIAAGQKNEVVAITAQAPLSYALLVSANSDITSVKELKGKKLGTTIGSTGHNLIDKSLNKAGFDINSDIELTNISTGDAATVLSSGEIDAVAIWEPTITRLVDNGTAKIIGTGADCGLLGVNVIVARSEYAEANPEVTKVIIEQFARGVKALENLDEKTKKR